MPRILLSFLLTLNRPCFRHLKRMLLFEFVALTSFLFLAVQDFMHSTVQQVVWKRDWQESCKVVVSFFAQNGAFKDEELRMVDPNNNNIYNDFLQVNQDPLWQLKTYIRAQKNRIKEYHYKMIIEIDKGFLLFFFNSDFLFFWKLIFLNL